MSEVKDVYHDLNHKFKIPVAQEIASCKENTEKVCVVSIIGKSPLHPHQCKASVLNNIIGKQIFVGKVPGEKSGNEFMNCPIEGYFDSEKKTVYLNLSSPYDANVLAALCLQKFEEKGGFQQILQDQEHLYTRSLLLTFSISHIIVVTQPGSCFDPSYVRLFRNLDSIRVKLQPLVADLLKGLPISKEWVIAGRPCSPRVLFVFDRPTIESDPEYDSKGKKTKSPAIRQLQHTIEDQIYRILRKARIITNISNNSLFAVPANQEFVHIYERSDADSRVEDPVNFMMTQLKTYCQQQEPVVRPHSYQTSRHGQNHASDSSKKNTLPSAPVSNGLQDFLGQHVELALSKGFDDNVTRRSSPVAPVFEITTFDTWCTVANRLHSFFMDEAKETPLKTHFNSLRSLMEIDSRFSESRCQKVLPLAEAAYQDGLPQFYPKNLHRKKLVQAKRVFSQHARGPACDKYLGQLEESCVKYWQDGHQQCEQRSLTGNPCLNELHRLSEADPVEGKGVVVLPHTSKLKMKSYCNCGKKVAERDDPFDHKTANYDFYQILEQSCCNKLEHLILPYFQPSTLDVKAGNIEIQLHKPAPVVRKDSGKLDTHLSNLSLVLSLGQSGGGSDRYSSGHASGEKPEPEVDETSDHSDGEKGDENDKESGDEDESEDEEKEESEAEENVTVEDEKPSTPKISSTVCALPRQASTTEYLPGMIHSDSPFGLLPKFSDWAITVLGRYTSYSHAQGLDQQGFLHGSNFLLPWDIVLKVDREKWPTIAETKKGRGKKAHRDTGEISLKVFVGVEYECPRGHRFMVSSPDRIIKTNSGPSLKESASKIVNMDMPLYFPCQCRNQKGFMAQMMRVYVASPEGPMQVTLNPQIQPAPPPCPLFYPGNEEPLRLSTGMVSVLRLPFAYVGNNGPYIRPMDPGHYNIGRVLKGLFGYIENKHDK